MCTLDKQEKLDYVIGLEIYTIVEFLCHLQFGIHNYAMFLWGVAVLELNSLSDHNKEQTHTLHR